VTLVDDNQWEPDETFDILLSLPPPEQQADDFKGAKLGDPCVSTITIINDDDPGVLFFPMHEFEVNEKDGKVVITVERKNGSDGTITCKDATQDHADKSGKLFFFYFFFFIFFACSFLRLLILFFFFFFFHVFFFLP
jgi:hypothetical protein